MMPHNLRRWSVTVAVAISFWALSIVATQAQVGFRAEAVVGEPFGVGQISLELPAGSLPGPLGIDGLSIIEREGRVLYPAVTKAPVLRILRGVLDRPDRATVYFLFRGSKPLDITVSGRPPLVRKITPHADAAAHRRLMGAWWREYTAAPRLLEDTADYPPLVENYLQAMLARRLRLPLAEEPRDQSGEVDLEEEIGVMLGTESIRAAMQRDRMLGRTALGEAADQALPPPVEPPPLEFPELPADVQIEPIANRVPAECLYMRFGTFANYLWFRDTLDRWGGDLRNLILLRGVNYGLNERVETQLALKETALSRLLGGTIIADVAIVGSDMFLREGAAIGILFQARNNLLLARDINRQRTEAIEQGENVTEKKVQIAGREVRFLSSPGNTVRSFYVVDGDYHFVTTSETLARRFLETADGKGSLGTSDEFRWARSTMPLSRDDTAFVYLSDTFFRNLTGPHYRVEMTRRLQAVADIELVQMAVLASATEGKPGETVDQLIAGGLLPSEFGPRPDGSRAVRRGGEVIDSLRGRRGSFLPVPDVEVTAVTPSEARSYAQFAQFYLENWGRMEPTFFGLKRHLDEQQKRERVVIDAFVSPVAQKHQAMLAGWLGKPDRNRLARMPGDVIAGEVVLRNQRLFGGLQDFGPPQDLLGGGLRGLIGGLRDFLVGYIGAHGDLGPLSVYDRRIVTPPDEHGYARGRRGLWRREVGEFTVYSLQPEVLAQVTPRLAFEQAERPAHVRLHVGDVTGARLTPFLNSLGYARTRGTSMGNLRFMHTLNQQLHVPAEHSRMAAEVLLDAELICPLGGEYEYRKANDGTGYWTSTALDRAGRPRLLLPSAPSDFVTPPLDWFRGLDLDASLIDRTLTAHAEIEMQLPQP